jgi:hypothetical protein
MFFLTWNLEHTTAKRCFRSWYVINIVWHLDNHYLTATKRKSNAYHESKVQFVPANSYKPNTTKVVSRLCQVCECSDKLQGQTVCLFVIAENANTSSTW